MKLYYNSDADLNLLSGKTVAIVGYGSQGHAQAQNLRDSGVNVVVAEVKDSSNWKLAESHGFSPVSADQAAKEADIVQILVPDELQRRVYESSIAPHLHAGNALVFSHVVGARKPHAAFFDYCRKMAGVKADQCVFIDDLPANVAGARRCGWQGIVYRDMPDLYAKFEQLGIELTPLG